MTTLQSTSEVIDALGGTSKVAALTRRSAQAVSNWRSFENFPPDTYLVMTSVLAAEGKSAPPSLWKQVKLGKSEASTAAVRGVA